MSTGCYEVRVRDDGRICQVWIRIEPERCAFWTGKIYESVEEARADVARLNERGAGEPPELIPAGSLARSLARVHGKEALALIEQGDAESAYRAARLAARRALDSVVARVGKRV